MVDRIDIERALDDLISNEEGMRFQSLAVVLAKLPGRWPELIASERKKDFGLDAYASASLSPDGRGKGIVCSITATFQKLNEDAGKAKQHYSDVSILLFATPQKVSKSTERDWADKIRSAYGYELTVISREEIISSLQVPDNAGICRTHLRISVPHERPIADLLQQTREAAATITASWAAHPRIAGKPQISLNAVAIDKRGNETAQVSATAQLRVLLLQARRLVLEAPAGRGKTTTLIQLARDQGDLRGIPFLIDLPAWMRSELDVLDYVARMPAFRARGIDAAALARLSQVEPLLFLLNGWNEISELHSQGAVGALRDLERAFPTAGIIVATRTHHIVPPLPGAARIRLLPLTRTQRLHYLERAIGISQAYALNSKLSADRVLDDLTRTPFILSEVTTIFESGREIPRTKLGLLGAVIALMEQMEEHGSHLQAQPLQGRAENYLRALAIRLTARGDVTLEEAEARTICHSVAETLRNNRQIASSPEPADVLNSLCAHHTLERLDYPRIGFRFEHQQLQEYYSALMLRDILAHIATTRDSAELEAFTRKYVNEPAWEEPLRMTAEEIAVADAGVAMANNVVMGGLLVQAALRVDPVFAATLARLCGSSLSNEVRIDLSQRLRSWYTAPNQHYRQCALAAMLATGSDEFADILIPLLTSPDQQVRLAAYRTGTDFYPSSLGPQWQEVVMAWQEQARIEFISELTMHQGRPDVALAFARADPSPAVRGAAIHALAWVGQRGSAMRLANSWKSCQTPSSSRRFRGSTWRKFHCRFARGRSRAIKPSLPELQIRKPASK